MNFFIGSTVTLRCTVADEAGEPVAGLSTPRFLIAARGGATDTVAASEVDPGVYEAPFTPTASGTHAVRFEGSSPSVASQDSIYVEPLAPTGGS